MSFKLLAWAALLVVVEAGQVTVYSNDNRIKYTGSDWTGVTGDFRTDTCTSGSPTYYHSENIGDSWSFTFVGTHVQVIELDDTDRGVVSYQLDEGTPNNINTRLSSRKCSIMYDSGPLENGSHTVVAKLVGKSPTNLNGDGTVICLQAIMYAEQDADDPPAGTTGAQTAAPAQTTSSSPTTQPEPQETSGGAVSKDAVGTSGSVSQSSPSSLLSQTLSAPGPSTTGTGSAPSVTPGGKTDAAQVTADNSAQVPTIPIVLGVVGGVIIVALIIFFLYWRRRLSRRNVISTDSPPPMRRVPPALALPSTSTRSHDRRPLTAQSVQTSHSGLSQDLTGSPSSPSAPDLQPLSVTPASLSDPSSLHSLPPLQPVRRLPPIPQSHPIASDPTQVPSLPSSQNVAYIPPATGPSRGPSGQASSASRSIPEDTMIALARQIALQLRQDPTLAPPVASNLNRSNTFATYMGEPPPCYEEPQ